MPKVTLKQHLQAARDEWELRQKTLKDDVIHGMKTLSKTWYGLSVYQWEEYDWDITPLADDDSEISCIRCLKAMGK